MRFTLRAAIVAAALTTAIPLLSGGASALSVSGFSQSWSTSASYRASKDWVPGGGTLEIGGKGCSGGSAEYWYSSLVRTSGSVVIGSSYSYPANGSTYYDPRHHGVSSGTAYYMRWYGQNDELQDGYSAPCQTVDAKPA